MLDDVGCYFQQRGVLEYGEEAIFEEATLMLDDVGCYFQQRFIAAHQAFDEPASLLQVVFQIGVVTA